MLWPDWIAGRIASVETFENVASIGHFMFSIVLALLPGCWRRYTLGYLLYQLITTAAKDVFFPGQHTLSDWSWDFIGDMEEWLAGYGLVYFLGGAGKLPARGPLAAFCSPRGAAAFYLGLAILWIALLARTLLIGPG